MSGNCFVVGIYPTQLMAAINHMEKFNPEGKAIREAWKNLASNKCREVEIVDREYKLTLKKVNYDKKDGIEGFIQMVKTIKGREILEPSNYQRSINCRYDNNLGGKMHLTGNRPTGPAVFRGGYTEDEENMGYSEYN